MSDKEQIMINDVDVSECIHLYSRWPGSIPPDSCACWEEPNDLTDTPVTDCKRHENCYFKQLARKTQECESLKQEIEILQNNFDTATRDCNELIEELRQECEELKDARFNLNCEIYSLNRYRKALEEIEGLVKNFCKDCDDYEDCNWDKEGCYYSLIPNLKDIINKAKDGKND